MLRNHFFIICVLLGLAQITAVSAADLNDNPLAIESALPYHYPPFDKIKDEHFVPAIEAGMREELKEIDPIANNSDKPTFDNTIVALERSGRLLDRARADLLEPERVRHKSDAAEDREGNGAETFCASRRDFLESEVVRARPGALRQAR